MQLIDTHCHLDLEQYKDDVGDVIKRAEDAGVVRMVCPGVSIESSEKCVELSEKYSPVFAAVGIHPHDADKATPEDILKLRELAVYREKVVAIGEIGLDHYRNYSDPENQKKVLRDCIMLAKELDLPVILHNREAEEDLLKIIKGTNHFMLEGVVHCFSGSPDFLKEIIKLDMYVSFAGNITFDKASKLREMIKNVPVDRLILETDSPYIAPEPFRGKRNEPAHVRYLLDVYAKIHGLAIEDVARITTHNADQLFRLGVKPSGTITYPIRDILYLNMTYRCTNRCCFCIRNASHHVKGHDLKLDKDPSAEEIIDAIGDISGYREVAFCGLGEPTLRLGVLKKVAAYIKEKGGMVRLNTNGEGNLIAGKPVAEELKGLVDKVSVSLNACDEENYDHTCHSVFGNEAYRSIVEFIKECRQNDIETEVTCLDFVGDEAISTIRGMAEGYGANFRLRHLNVVG
ncbi:TatD family hydrolase [Candidatus Omnitrophota bacterium]